MKLPHDRKWQLTSLGYKLENGEHQVNSQDLVFTVMSYNVLADHLAKMHPELYSIDVESDILKWSLRFHRLIEEIQKHDGDIVCLQEIHHGQFHFSFRPALESLGYDGLYKKRTGDKQDGCAIFFKRDKLNLVSHTDVEYRQPLASYGLDRDNVGLLV